MMSLNHRFKAIATNQRPLRSARTSARERESILYLGTIQEEPNEDGGKRGRFEVVVQVHIPTGGIVSHVRAEEIAYDTRGGGVGV